MLTAAIGLWVVQMSSSDMWQPTPVTMTRPHFRGIGWMPSEADKFETAIAEIEAAATPGNSLLLLLPDAATYYLASGVKNPTPYDFPLASVFGRNGQQTVRNQIASGAIPKVCVADAFPAGLAPEVVRRHVQSTMDAGESLGSCRMYSRRAR